MSLTQSNEEINTNYERRLMEKDKAFFDLSKTTKIIENEKEAFENKVKSQECEILNLNNEISSIQSMLKIKDSQLETKEEKIKKLTQQLKTKETDFVTQMQSKDKKINELTNAFNSQLKDYEGVMSEAKKIELHNNKISNDSIDKDNMIKSLQTIIFELKKENKQIYTLTKVLSEKDEKVNWLVQQNDKLISQNNDLCNENNQFKIRINNISSASLSPGGVMGVSQYYIRPNQNALLNEKTLIELQNNFKNHLEQKDKYFNELNLNYKQALKDKEKLIQFTISQIKQIEKSLDITMTYNITTNNSVEPLSSERGYQNLISNTNTNANVNTCNTQHSLKYDLIAKNFDLISKKIFDKLSSNHIMVEQYQNETSEIEEKCKDYQFLNEKLRQEKSLLENNIIKINEELRDSKRSFEEIEKKYSDLLNRFNTREKILSESNEKYSSLEIETNDFCNKCLGIVHNFLSNDSQLNTFQYNDAIKIKEEKIIESFNMIAKALIKQNNKEMELIKEAQISNEKIEKLSNDIDQLNQQYEEMIRETRASFNAKEEEYKKQKSIIVSKMNELSALLEESNGMIGKYEEENYLLKAKNNKIEHNLQMLTCSHSEIEKTIENNNSYSNEVIKQKEHRINTLLREVELKDIQIKSLEKLLNELKVPPVRTEESLFQMKQIKGKLLSKNQYRSLILKKNNDDSFQFVPNEKHENELKNMFQKIPLGVNNDHSCVNIHHEKGLDDSEHSNNNCENEELKVNSSFNTAPLIQGYNQKLFHMNNTTGYNS